MTGPTGTVTRVDGPVVHLRGMPGVVHREYVEVGRSRLPGEVITVERDGAVVQLFEYSGGLSVGEPAWTSGHPVTVDLGPGILGGIYDGLLRPLSASGDFLDPQRPGETSPRTHRFEPTATTGSVVGEGQVLGRVRTTGDVEHLVLVPPGCSGTLDDIAPAAEYGPWDAVATVAGRPVSLTSRWAIRHPRPAGRRNTAREPFRTGQRVLDIIAPVARGGNATVIGGFGEGKTMLLEQIAKWSDADVIIYVGCGERGNELTDLIEELSELVDPRTGRHLMERTVILANTSNMPVMAREAGIYTAVTVAEYFRDMGHHAVLIADSTSRWAEAQRELASRTGAIPAEEGYPADLPAALADFYQRAGRVTTTGGLDGTVTIVTSVSPPGGDVTEPVSAHTQRFVQAVWTLDRTLAYARHYPAVSWRSSFSREATAIAAWHAEAGDPDWARRRARIMTLLSESDRLEAIADLVGHTALPTTDRLVLLGGRLAREAVLQQNAMDPNDATCSPAKQAALVRAVLDVHDAALTLATGGVPATLIEGFDLGPLLRAKQTVASDDAAAVDRIAADLVTALEGLAR